ncbi:MAG: NAD(P)H-binding protein [Nitrospira sp.]|nr:NAD(P)H-binding protein [Nitrospira sp.]
MFVVLGVTGHTGKVVAETLLARKQPVRVVVRSADQGGAWRTKGAEVAVASLDDVPALTRAFQGASGLYVLVPPNYGASSWLVEQRKRVDHVAEAVKASAVPHVVLLSSVGAQLPSETGPIRAVRYGEQQLRAVTRNVTAVRPCYFMENWAVGFEMARQQGVLPTFTPPQVRIPMVSARDIGRVAAERLIAGGSGHVIVELAGPEEYSPEQVGVEFGRLLGRKVETQAAPLSAVVPTMTSFGFSDEAARLFEEMYASFSKGTIVYEFPTALVRGTISLAEAVRGMA